MDASGRRKEKNTPGSSGRQGLGEAASQLPILLPKNELAIRNCIEHLSFGQSVKTFVKYRRVARRGVRVRLTCGYKKVALAGKQRRGIQPITKAELASHLTVPSILLVPNLPLEILMFSCSFLLAGTCTLQTTYLNLEQRSMQLAT